MPTIYDDVRYVNLISWITKTDIIDLADNLELALLLRQNPMFIGPYFEIPQWPSEIPANNYEKNFGEYK